MKNLGFKRVASKYSLVLILVAFMIVFTIISPHFLTATNLINVLRQQSVVILLSFGEMVLIMARRLTLEGAQVKCGALLKIGFISFHLAYRFDGCQGGV